MDKKAAQRIVNALLTELEGRGGFDILNIIHDDTGVYNEMYEACVSEVLKTFFSVSRPDPQDSHWYPEENKEDA